MSMTLQQKIGIFPRSLLMHFVIENPSSEICKSQDSNCRVPTPLFLALTISGSI